MKKTSFVNCCLACFLVLSFLEGKAVRPVNLRTEYLREPIGISASVPSFSWEYQGSDNSFIPLRSEIRIGTSPKLLSVYNKGMTLKPHTRYYWNVTVWSTTGKRSEVSDLATFETGKFSFDDWSAQWISDNHDTAYLPAPLFRKSFSIAKRIKEARLYVAAAGYYELFINGRRVGTNYLDPGYTHFDKRILYVTHDITSLLRQGENAVSSVLGNGWYNEQSVALWEFNKARWRARPSMLCELRIIHDDGTIDVVGSDESWRTETGPFRFNNIYSGDHYDATMEKSGWKTVDFDDAAWQPATVVKSPTKLLVAQQMPAIHGCEKLTPVNVRKFSETDYLFTFDKNIAGFCRLEVEGEALTKLTIKYGERLDSLGHVSHEHLDQYFTPEFDGEKFQTDEYVMNGSKKETFSPSFTYHGFQYVEVTSSKPIELSTDNLTALFVHTDVHPVGTFQCSDHLLNGIWKASANAYLSNLHSIPTDCPTREKNGWTGDGHMAIDFGTYAFDGITVYEKWMNDFIDNQRDNGAISGIIPTDLVGYGDWIGPVWDASLFIIPNALYNYYGDLRTIERLYPTMERYLKYISSRETDGLLTWGIGDWLPWNAKTNTVFTSTAYYYLDNMLMARFARLLDKDDSPYLKKAVSTKEVINAKFYNQEKKVYAEGTQTSQAVALSLGLVPDGDQQAVADRLHQLVKDNDYFLDFGMLGSKTVVRMLTKYGYVEDAMKMVTKREQPSWGYWIEQLNTKSLAESWRCNSSLNHVFLCDVSAWMMSQLAGISYDSAAPGFVGILIEPHFVKELDWVKGEYNSISGLVRSEWSRKNGVVTLRVRIPLGSRAMVKVDNRSIAVGSGFHSFKFNEDS